MAMNILKDRSKVVLRYILEKNAVEFPDKECILFEDGERWTNRSVWNKAIDQPTYFPDWNSA